MLFLRTGLYGLLHPADAELYLVVIGPLFSTHSPKLGFVQPTNHEVKKGCFGTTNLIVGIDKSPSSQIGQRFERLVLKYENKVIEPIAKVHPY
jgi:hypothetical protein